LSHAVDCLTRQLGESHADTIDAMAILGDTLAAKGENGHAERLYLRVVELYSQTVGERSPKTAQALNSLSNFYMDWGDFAKAEACSTRALKTLRSAAKVDPVDLVTGIVAVATVHTRTNRLAEAEKEFAEALEIAQRQPHPSPTLLASIAFALQHVKDK